MARAAKTKNSEACRVIKYYKTGKCPDGSKRLDKIYEEFLLYLRGMNQPISENQPSNERNWIVPTNQKYNDTTRSFTVENIQVMLQVQPSTIPNVGDGLFLSFDYINNNDKSCNDFNIWIVPSNGVNLGIYAPNIQDDMKQTIVFEAKNFIFEWKMQEWSFARK